MCNLYSQKKSLQEVKDWFNINSVDPSAGNLPELKSIFPGYKAPVVLRQEGGKSLEMMKWGFVLLHKNKAPKYINNCRDDRLTESIFWKSSFIERRCLIPASKFSEYHPFKKNEKGHKASVWFELEAEELFAFAGIWKRFRGKLKGNHAEFNTFSIVTTKPNSIVKSIHPTRMPVILDPDSYDFWLDEDIDLTVNLIKSYPSQLMRISKIGSNSDD